MLEKYWKLDNLDKTMNEQELFEYGEYLLKIVDEYKESVPQLNWLKLSLINKPYNFDMKIFVYYCMSKSYQELLNYLNLWVENINSNLQNEKGIRITRRCRYRCLRCHLRNYPVTQD
jgi:hypothetical protein